MLDDFLGFDAELVEALEPGAEKALEGFSAAVLSGFRARLIFLPFDVGVEEGRDL